MFVPTVPRPLRMKSGNKTHLVTVSGKFSTIIDYTMRFSHSSLMNTSLGESSKFQMSYISIPSSYSSTIATSEGLPS